MTSCPVVMHPSNKKGQIQISYQSTRNSNELLSDSLYLDDELGDDGSVPCSLYGWRQNVVWYLNDGH